VYNTHVATRFPCTTRRHDTVSDASSCPGAGPEGVLFAGCRYTCCYKTVGGPITRPRLYKYTFRGKIYTYTLHGEQADERVAKGRERTHEIVKLRVLHAERNSCKRPTRIPLKNESPANSIIYYMRTRKNAQHVE